MVVTVNVHEAKTHLSKLLVKVGQGEEIIIAKAGRPVARLVAVGAKPRERLLGIDQGKIWMAPDFDETPQDILDLFYQGPVEPQ